MKTYKKVIFGEIVCTAEDICQSTSIENKTISMISKAFNSYFESLVSLCGNLKAEGKITIGKKARFVMLFNAISDKQYIHSAASKRLSQDVS